MEIRIRPASEADLPAVNRLRAQVNEVHVQGRPDIFKPGFGQDIQDHLAQRFADEEGGVLVAEADGRIAGFAMVQYIHRPESPYNLPRDYYQVEEFGVDPAWRRQGVATALTAYMKADAKRRGFPRIELDMWEFNQGALAFYEAAGFRTYRRYMELNTEE